MDRKSKSIMINRKNVNSIFYKIQNEQSKKLWNIYHNGKSCYNNKENKNNKYNNQQSNDKDNNINYKITGNNACNSIKNNRKKNPIEINIKNYLKRQIKENNYKKNDDKIDKKEIKIYNKRPIPVYNNKYEEIKPNYNINIKEESISLHNYKPLNKVYINTNKISLIEKSNNHRSNLKNNNIYLKPLFNFGNNNKDKNKNIEVKKRINKTDNKKILKNDLTHKNTNNHSIQFNKKRNEINDNNKRFLDKNDENIITYNHKNNHQYSIRK